MSAAGPHAILIAVGNPYRGDDGAGPAVASAVREADPEVRVVETDGEPSRLLDAWEGADLAVLVDAVHSDAAPVGHVHRLVVTGEVSAPLAASAGAGSHGLGAGEAVALGRALGRLPGRLVILGIEGERFGIGERMSAEVVASVRAVAGEVVELIGGGS